MEEFDRLTQMWPEVVICERITGAVDYMVKVVTEDIKSYDNFLRNKLPQFRAGIGCAVPHCRINRQGHSVSSSQ